MTVAESKRGKLKSVWDTAQKIVAFLSGLIALVAVFAYLEHYVIAYLIYAIYLALAIFIVSLTLVLVPRVIGQRKQETNLRAQTRAEVVRETLAKSPVKVVREGLSIGARDSIATGLRKLTIPLNKTPTIGWVRCFTQLPVIYLSLHEANVVNASIETKCSEDSVLRTVDAISDLVDRTNQDYDKFLKEEEKRRHEEDIRRTEEARRLAELEKAARRQP
ncbi:MAG: hypothetical protein ABSE82_17420 [Nitrososphaerales archaeon]|jgi:hypothetical protein